MKRVAPGLPSPVNRWSGCCRLPLLTWRALRWRLLQGRWLRDHLTNHQPFDPARLRPQAPIDVMVLIVDHFEPLDRHGPRAAVASVQSWCDAYETLARRHEDADGLPPQHSWFYRAEYPNLGCIQAIGDAAFRGLGEVEFHLHHGHDTHDSFAAQLRQGLDWFNLAGAMWTAEAEPRQRFGYVAGNWALDNGAGDDSLSGCNTELLALREAGCYADFTFPALGSPAQPRKTNTIYYATDDPRPKSYDRGTDVARGVAPSGDLMIFQGPTVIDWRHGRFEDGALESFAPPSPARLDAWLTANVHVRGRPDWVFVKLHTHGIQSREAFLSPHLDALFTAMEARWNRPPFRLHYVTAREAYNIVKAAEAGCEGDPHHYRDFAIPRPANRQVRCSGAWQLLAYTPDRVDLRVLESGPVRIDFAEGPLRGVHGMVRRLVVEFDRDEIESLEIDGDGPFEVASTRPLTNRETGIYVPT